MREMNWRPARRTEGLLIDRPRLTARAVNGRGQTLVSGDLHAAIAALAPCAPLLGLFCVAPEDAHALRIASDRALLVTPAPLAAAEGWRGGWCVTGLDHGFVAIDVAGADAPSALARGPRRTSPPARPPRPSCSPGSPACWGAQATGSGFMSRRRGSRRC